MVNAYWHIGREIVEVEQKGKGRAEYGQNLLGSLSERLTADYGKGFNSRNLAYMRQFYQTFPNLNALRSELSLTHYRILMRIEKDAAREFYMQESIEGNWSTRQLERQVSSHYFERMLMTKEDNSPQLTKD